MLKLKKPYYFTKSVCLALPLFLLLGLSLIIQNPKISAQVTEITTKIEEVNQRNNASSKVQKSIQELEAENLDYQKEVVELEKSKTENEENLNIPEIDAKIQEINTKIEANKGLINNLSEQKNDLEVKKEEEVDELKQTIVVGGVAVFAWVLVLVAIWAVYEILNIAVSRLVKNVVVKKYLKTTLLMIAITSTILTLLYALAPNLSLIFTSLSLVSAAAVFAFQELFSSMVSFPLIKIQKLYKVGDIVKFGDVSNSQTGKIIKIDLLRTLAEERVSIEDTEQAEQNTRKIISLPNNTILKFPIINFSQNQNIIKDKIQFTITFGSDLEKARIVVEGILTSWSKSTFKTPKQQKLYETYLDIAGDGPRFTIWYPTVIGQSRKNKTDLSIKILEELRNNGLELAYKTITLDK